MPYLRLEHFCVDDVLLHSQSFELLVCDLQMLQHSFFMDREILLLVLFTKPFFDLDFNIHKKTLAEAKVAAIFRIVIILEELDCLKKAVECV